MRLLFLLTIFLLPCTALAVTGDEARFDWSYGQPSIQADNTSTCNDTATARFEWSYGQPAILLDATANCTSAPGGGATSTVRDDFWNDM
jgi:hypothetical protein